MDEYLGRVRGVRVAVSDFVPSERLVNVDSLIDHGEPAEGMCSPAWVLHDDGVAVPAWIWDAIRDLTDGLVAPEHMPPRSVQRIQYPSSE